MERAGQQPKGEGDGKMERLVTVAIFLVSCFFVGKSMRRSKTAKGETIRIVKECEKLETVLFGSYIIQRKAYRYMILAWLVVIIRTAILWFI